MGVVASISILLHGKLWGLFACQHMAPRLLGFERRMVAELFGQVFSLMSPNGSAGTPNGRISS